MFVECLPLFCPCNWRAVTVYRSLMGKMTASILTRHILCRNYICKNSWTFEWNLLWKPLQPKSHKDFLIFIFKSRVKKHLKDFPNFPLVASGDGMNFLPTSKAVTSLDHETVYFCLNLTGVNVCPLFSMNEILINVKTAWFLCCVWFITNECTWHSF